MNNFKNFKKFWEKEEPEIVTTNNLEEPGIYRLLQRPMTFEYDKIDLEMIKQFLDEGFNRVELEMQRLRESTGENYMLNKMINTDGVNFFVEYTLYKDYDKYFGLTLDGESINVVDIMEEEFAEFLSHYRLSAIYPQVEAVHEDSWHITPEENETIKEVLNKTQTASYTPVYDSDDKNWLHGIWGVNDITTVNEDVWTKTPTNTDPDYAKLWIETSTNTSPYYVEPWTSGTVSVESGAISVGSSTTSVAPETFYIDGAGNKSDQEKLAESVKFIESLLAQEEQVETKDSPNTLKNTENKSRTELISKIVADIIKELFTEGTCSINITLGQE